MAMKLLESNPKRGLQSLVLICLPLREILHLLPMGSALYGLVQILREGSGCGCPASDTSEEPGFWQVVFSAHHSPDVLEKQSNSSRMFNVCNNNNHVISCRKYLE